MAVFIGGRKLCFENGSFDISYSNAVIEVIEHVEGADQQRFRGSTGQRIGIKEIDI